VVAAPLVVLLAVLGACATGASDRSVPTTTRRLRVVATTMILGDVARTVAGDRADVTVLTGPTDDPSAFTLAPGPAAELTSADVILRIDPDYEQGLTAAIDQARAAGWRPCPAPTAAPTPTSGWTPTA
jgi:ABC-type Zn uptake system ZnuABC Zn-binding protein ZnuA